MAASTLKLLPTSASQTFSCQRPRYKPAPAEIAHLTCRRPFRDLHSAFRKSRRLSEIGICIIRNVMTATPALHKQIECYRMMTGEERLAIALNLHDVSCDIAREGIRHDHPEADPAEVERLLRRRLELSRAG